MKRRVTIFLLSGAAIALTLFYLRPQGDSDNPTSGQDLTVPGDINVNAAASPPSDSIESSAKSLVPNHQLVYEIDELNFSEKQAAWDAGFEKVSEIDPQRILRWRSVRIDPTIFATTESGYGIENITSLTLPFFDDQIIDVVRTRYRGDRDASMFSWTGTRKDGSLGEVSIHVVRDQDSSELKASIHYTDRFQDLHIVPTNDGRFYVATETYRGYELKIDWATFEVDIKCSTLKFVL